MNVLFISPHFPTHFRLFCRALQAEGATVLGLGDAPRETLVPELASTLTDYVYVPDLHRYDDVLRAVAGLIHRHGRIDRLDSLNEYWLELEAKLREDFNVTGQRPADTAKNRSKTGMKQLFAAADVACTEGEKITSPAQALALADRWGYPVVFKPDVGVGAARTFKIRTHEELVAVLEEPVEGCILERFETGALTSFDGLADRDGNIVYCVSHRYSSGIMDIVNDRLDMHYWTRRVIPPALEAAGRRVVKAFGIRERFFHLEMFETADGGFKALEINVRPPGGFTPDLMNFTSDVDVYALWAKVVTGKDLSGFTYERKYHCVHASRRDELRYRHSGDAVRHELASMIVAQGRMPEIFSGAMGDDYFMLRHPDEATLLGAVRFVLERA